MESRTKLSNGRKTPIRRARNRRLKEIEKLIKVQKKSNDKNKSSSL